MIKVLSKETIDKIAAGEVVERPESVVKELLDNALDSKATAISIELRDGGTALIRVTDNGIGIAKDELPTAFLRHATSKLNSADDLYRITTMGFRGEALASICGVAQVEMITKRKDDLLGHRYRIEGGVEQSLDEIGAPDGTSVIVRNLFFNVPVRKTFLKSKVTETAYAADVCEKIALAHPGVSVRLISDGKLLLHTVGNGNIKDVIYTIFGKDISRECIKVENSQFEGIKVSGYIGKPIIARAKRDYEIFYVNGRNINSDIIRKAVEDAYEPFMMQHRFPFVVIMLDIDPEAVDVNVHPKKSEVRFSDSKKIYDAVFAAVRNALLGDVVIAEPKLEELKKPKAAAPQKPMVKLEPFEVKREARELGGRTAEHKESAVKMAEVKAPEVNAAEYKAPEVRIPEVRTPEVKKPAVSAAGPVKAEVPEDNKPQAVEVKQQEAEPAKPQLSSEPTKSQAPDNKPQAPVEPTKPQAAEYKEQLELNLPFLMESDTPYFKIVGQVFDTYWIIEYNKYLYLIDQHAAHEKVNYERLVKAVKTNAISSQQIYPPILITLSLREQQLFEKYEDAFTRLGYEIEKIGDRDYFVRAVPAGLPELKDSELIKELIDGLDEERGLQTPEIILDKLASMSCKQAIKGNRHVDRMEMEALIKELLKLDNPYNCPHGRPTIIKWSKQELDKMFKRII